MKRRTRRLGRILFNTLTAISLLLAIATAGLWVRSSGLRGFTHLGIVERSIAGTKHPRVTDRVCGLLSWDGSLVILDYQSSIQADSYALVDYRNGLPPIAFRAYGWNPQESTAKRAWWRLPERKTLDVSMTLGRNTHSSTLGLPSSELKYIRVPTWSILVAFLSLPVLILGRAARQFLKSKPGHCPACGYDMRANPTKCSECGHELSELANRTRNGT